MMMFGDCRTWRIGGEQVPHVTGSAGSGDRELRGQHRCEEPLHHISEGNQGQAEPLTVGMRRRHGDGHREEGKARS